MYSSSIMAFDVSLSDMTLPPTVLPVVLLAISKHAYSLHARHAQQALSPARKLSRARCTCLHAQDSQRRCTTAAPHLNQCLEGYVHAAMHLDLHTSCIACILCLLHDVSRADCRASGQIRHRQWARSGTAFPSTSTTVQLRLYQD